MKILGIDLDKFTSVAGTDPEAASSATAVLYSESDGRILLSVRARIDCRGCADERREVASRQARPKQRVRCSPFQSVKPMQHELLGAVTVLLVAYAAFALYPALRALPVAHSAFTD